MIKLLNERKVPISRIKANLGKMQSIGASLAGYCAQDPALKYLAQKVRSSRENENGGQNRGLSNRRVTETTFFASRPLSRTCVLSIYKRTNPSSTYMHFRPRRLLHPSACLVLQRSNLRRYVHPFDLGPSATVCSRLTYRPVLQKAKLDKNLPHALREAKARKEEEESQAANGEADDNDQVNEESSSESESEIAEETATLAKVCVARKRHSSIKLRIERKLTSLERCLMQPVVTKVDKMFRQKNKTVLSEHFAKMTDRPDGSGVDDEDDDLLVMSRRNHDLDEVHEVRLSYLNFPLRGPELTQIFSLRSPRSLLRRLPSVVCKN